MTTARTLIEQAFKKIGVLGGGQSLQAEEANDGLITLNNLLQSWSVEGGLVYTETTEEFSLVGSQQTYTMGSGGDFNTTRPVEIRLVTVTSGSTDYTCEQYDQTQWGAISDKRTTQGIPSAFYYDANQPTATISYYPIPAGVTTTTIYSVKPLTEFTNLDTDLTLAVGLDRALIFNLAIDLAPDFNKIPNEAVVRVANESKANYFTGNAVNENTAMTVDDAFRESDEFRNFNVLRGYN